jgi:glycosyltransferase involved in cell wall biosynthesis
MAPVLDLDHIRQAITCERLTCLYLEKYADQLHLTRHPGEILSVSDIANRMISLKLDPRHHPLRDDRMGRLVLMGIRLWQWGLLQDHWRGGWRRFSCSPRREDHLMECWGIFMSSNENDLIVGSNLNPRTDHYPGSEPSVSIVINNYNYGQYLGEAINSALGQSYRNVEIIVVDDGSTDHSRDVIREFGDQVSRVIKENGGQASALNAGFARSHGDLIIFLDADDILLPDTAQRVAEAFQTDAAIAKIQYRMEVIDAQGRRTGRFKPAPHLPLQSGDLRRHELAFPFDLVRMATSGNAFSAKVLRQIFPIPENDFRLGADWYVTHLASLFGPVRFLTDVGAYYRVHGGNKYEQMAPVLDLDHIRQAITCEGLTRLYLEKYADQLHLTRHPGEILSVSDIANRMISLKLDPRQHPLRGDRMGRLMRMGIRVSLRRFDVAWAMKILFLGWFMAMGLAPGPLARWLAEVFLFPEKRRPLNGLLGDFHVNK